MAAVFVRYHVRPPSATGDATRVSNVMKSMIILMVFSYKLISLDLLIH